MQGKVTHLVVPGVLWNALSLRVVHFRWFTGSVFSRRQVPRVQCHNRLQNHPAQGNIWGSHLHQCWMSRKGVYSAPSHCSADVNERDIFEAGYWGCLGSHRMCSHTAHKRDIVHLIAEYDASRDPFWQPLCGNSLSFHPFHKWYKV